MTTWSYGNVPVCPSCGIELDHLTGQIDRANGLGPATHAGEHLTQWRGNRVGIERGSRHLGQQRVKDHVVLAVEDHDLAFLRGQPAPQRPGALHAAEPAAHNHDSPWCRFHHAGEHSRNRAAARIVGRSRDLLDKTTGSCQSPGVAALAERARACSWADSLSAG